MSPNTLLPVVAAPHDPTHAGRRPQLVALVAPDALAHPHVIHSLALYAAQGERLGLIIGNNHFALHALTRLARQHGVDSRLLLTHIELSRAFTCHQLHYRVLSLDPQYLQRWRALYVLGLLDTFFDESVPFHESARLLQDVLQRLQELAREGLAILITAALPDQPGRERLLDIVARHVEEYSVLQGEVPPPAAATLRQMLMPF
jgi:hypothetical protein